MASVLNAFSGFALMQAGMPALQSGSDVVGFCRKFEWRLASCQ